MLARRMAVRGVGRRVRGAIRRGARAVSLFLLCVVLTAPEAALSKAQAVGPRPTIDLVGMPDRVVIGESFTFAVVFENTGDAAGYAPFVDVVLEAGGEDLDLAGLKCDGVAFASAALGGAGSGDCAGASCTCFEGDGPACAAGGLSSPPVPLIAGEDFHLSTLAPCGPAGPVTGFPHPYGNHPTHPALGPLNLAPGAQLLTVALPFGSFQPTQPAVAVQVTARVSDFAFPSFPYGGAQLKIAARGGFRHGQDALDNPGTDPPIIDAETAGLPGTAPLLYDAWPNQHLLDTALLTLSKRYLGPEHEAVTGPNFTDHYPLRYDVAANLGDGQTFSDFRLWDHFGLALNVVPGSFSSSTGTQATTNPLSAGYGASLVPPPDPDFGFGFFLPRVVGGGELENPKPLLDPKTCATVRVPNDVRATGKWKPLDPRDANPDPLSGGLWPLPPDTHAEDYVLDAQCVAIQKGVEQWLEHGEEGATPLDILRYTLEFQISDYFAFGNLVVTDRLADGLEYLTNPGVFALPKPKLTVTDRFGTKTTEIVPGLEIDPAVAVDSCALGGTELTFDVSAAIQKRTTPTDPGILTGGHAQAPTSPVPATGTITYFVRIMDTFRFPWLQPGDAFVVKHDPLPNCAFLQAVRYDISPTSPPNPPPFGYAASGVRATDQSGAAVTIIPDTVVKTVYARNGQVGGWTVNADGLPQFTGDDTITFRIQKVVPSGDAEHVTIRDWLPQPALPIPSGGLTFTNDRCAAVFAGNNDLPPAGHLCLGPDDDLAGVPLSPVFGYDTADQSFTLDYGSFNDPVNNKRTIDVLVTLAVSDAPFADGLYLTNEVQECEWNSFNGQACQIALARFELTEPKLKLTKGVVGTDNAAGVFKPATVGPVTFLGPPSSVCPRFGATVHSKTPPPTGLDQAPVDSDLAGVDAGDTVTYAIVVENLGSGLHGAFDVAVKDWLDPALTYVPGTLCVSDGTGTPLTYTYASGAFGASPLDRNLFHPFTGIRLDDAGAAAGSLAPYDPASGKNIAVITFDAKLAGDVEPGCYRNRAELLGYAVAEGGPNFVPAGFVVDPDDDAWVCVGPEPRKAILGTSELHTAPQASAAGVPPLTIGEIVKYRVTVAVPEGVSPAFQVKDTLPPALVPLAGSVVVDIPAPVTASAPWTVAGGPQACDDWGTTPLPGPMVFDLKTLTNPAGTAPNPNVVTITFNALVCNMPGNHDGQSKVNRAELSIDGKAYPEVAAAATIVEPRLAIAKRMISDVDLAAGTGQALEYEVVVKNTGMATAYDVEVRDPVPGCLSTLQHVGAVRVPGGGTNGILVLYVSSPATARILVDSIPPGTGVRLRYRVKLACRECDKLVNTASVTWTSLPGAHGTAGTSPNNGTGAATPGQSGQVDGERTGHAIDPGHPRKQNAYFAAAGLALCGKVCGHKFEDLDGDGVRDEPGEPLLDGWTVHLTPFNGGAPAGTAVTGPPAFAHGQFCVEGLLGSYKLAEVNQAGWVQTAPAPPGTHTVWIPVGAPPGVISTGHAFGNVKTAPPCCAEVCGAKFLDGNGDGVKNPGEVNISGWPIGLFDAATGAMTPLTATSTENGRYCATLCGQGPHLLGELAVPGWAQTAPPVKPPFPGLYEVMLMCAPPPAQATVKRFADGVVVANDKADFGNVPEPPACAPPAAGTPAPPAAVYAWGTNRDGQVLGTGGPLPAKKLWPGSFVAVDAGGVHSLALDGAGAIHQWGSPIAAPAGKPAIAAKALAAGDGGHSLALDAAGALWAWGHAGGGKLPCGGGGPPCPVAGPWRQVAAGWDFSLALKPNGDIQCWGNAAVCGGKPSNSAGDPFASVAAGFTHALAITQNTGTLRCWPAAAPACAGIPAGGLAGPFKAAAGGHTHSLALSAKGGEVGKIYTFGTNLPPSLTAAPGALGFAAIAAGYEYSLALAADGALHRWGENLPEHKAISNAPSSGKWTAIAASSYPDWQSHALAIQCAGGAPTATPTTDPGVPPIDTPTPAASPTPTASRTPAATATRTPTPASTPTPSPTATPQGGKLGNISTRGRVGTGDKVMIGGFIVAGGPARVVVRAIGPSLARFGVPGALQDPTLTLHSGPAVMAEGDDWQASPWAAQLPPGLQPADPREAAMVVTLQPGAYTAIVRGKGGTTGVALVEAFHVGGAGALSNISTRGDVQTGADILIGGFIVQERTTRVVIRAIGPDLANRGVPGSLPDPDLVLFDGTGKELASNLGWQVSPWAALIPPGLRPADPREAVIVVDLAPGGYTAHMRRQSGATGIGLAEVYRAGP